MHLCLHETQNSVLPGMYVGQFDQIHVTLIEAYAMPLWYPQPISMITTLIVADANIELWQHQVPHETIRELSDQGELFKDILHRVILPA